LHLIATGTPPPSSSAALDARTVTQYRAGKVSRRATRWPWSFMPWLSPAVASTLRPASLDSRVLPWYAAALMEGQQPPWTASSRRGQPEATSLCRRRASCWSVALTTCQPPPTLHALTSRIRTGRIRRHPRRPPRPARPASLMVGPGHPRPQ
jgi:hypothetical protein